MKRTVLVDENGYHFLSDGQEVLRLRWSQAPDDIGTHIPNWVVSAVLPEAKPPAAAAGHSSCCQPPAA